ncbi:MAG: glycosyltransferase family 2 protein [Lachnospiraceae bacterium]
MSNKKISVIIPCYNVSKWLPQCFLSLVNQTIGIENLELIFVNDASTDKGKTLELLEEMEHAYPKEILVINLEENMRQGGARNIGLTYATGEYIGFVDADDWVETTLFERVYEKAKETNADIVQFSHKIYVDGVGELPNGDVSKPCVIEIKSAAQRKKMLMEERITYGCWNKLYRRAMIVKAGVTYAEHTPYEEPLFVYPLLFCGTTFVVISDRLYDYRQNREGTMHRDMKEIETLYQHAQVQLEVWNFMKKTVYFLEYQEEIEFYFMHTYFYETLYFARLRGLTIPYERYEMLVKVIKKEVPKCLENQYLEQAPIQRKLLENMEQIRNQQLLNSYINKMPVENGKGQQNE